MGKWTEISAEDIHVAEQRLAIALGNNASDVVSRINTDSTFTSRIVEYMMTLISKTPTAQFRKVKVEGGAEAIRLIQLGIHDPADHFAYIRT